MRFKERNNYNLIQKTVVWCVAISCLLAVVANGISSLSSAISKIEKIHNISTDIFFANCLQMGKMTAITSVINLCCCGVSLISILCMVVYLITMFVLNIISNVVNDLKEKSLSYKVYNEVQSNNDIYLTTQKLIC